MTVSAGKTPGKIYRRFTLSPDNSQRLKRLARSRRVSESEVVEKALAVFFSLTEFFEADDDRPSWHLLSEKSVERVWDNDHDAAYDNWKTLYGISDRPSLR